MTTDAVPPDRRAALKARHRRAILDAANALITEGVRFSVDQLAERADVSRRTIFNHFSSIDDVVTTVCTEMLGDAIAGFRTTVTSGQRASMFEDVAGALRATDVPGIIAFLWRALGGFAAGDPQATNIFLATFQRTSEEMARELARRYPDADPLDAAILVSSLMNGTVVVATHWITVTSAATDTGSRDLWHQLLDRMITNVRTGY
ncbi:TetR/AcrR family transcriptional regulator [Actinoplanes sp. NEAU-A12]|uniref:TetR/AcrR family transcriptional regulator n=1 Tax=Actinoplanes sandaracinus TaxID=3045177 RepID=A0ABT6WSC7_9ACTN|nr:TetR/AcrR family transcriptional regulator [Actinoplanes sandaracinus]MDI6102639.1 TetR/AcrR family transcriptional regulator [Actinoplanes sandaracinus]